MKQKNQTKIIILEGVTTTGKSSVFYNLQRYAKEHNLNWIFVPETETTIPIIDSIDPKKNNNHLEKLLKRALGQKADLYVFDRLHFSSIFKTNAKTEDLKEVEEILSEFDAQIFMLYVPVISLRERIKESMKYRNVEWTEYLLNKVGGDKEKVADIYVNRQELVMQLMKKSLLKINIVDTSDQNFVRVTRQIIDELKLKPNLN